MPGCYLGLASKSEAARLREEDEAVRGDPNTRALPPWQMYSPSPMTPG